MTDTGQRAVVKQTGKVAEEMPAPVTLRWQSDWGMISTATKKCFGER